MKACTTRDDVCDRVAQDLDAIVARLQEVALAVAVVGSSEVVEDVQSAVRLLVRVRSRLSPVGETLEEIREDLRVTRDRIDTVGTVK